MSLKNELIKLHSSLRACTIKVLLESLIELNDEYWTANEVIINAGLKATSLNRARLKNLLNSRLEYKGIGHQYRRKFKVVGIKSLQSNPTVQTRTDVHNPELWKKALRS